MEKIEKTERKMEKKARKQYLKERRQMQLERCKEIYLSALAARV